MGSASLSLPTRSRHPFWSSPVPRVQRIDGEHLRAEHVRPTGDRGAQGREPSPGLRDAGSSRLVGDLGPGDPGAGRRTGEPRPHGGAGPVELELGGVVVAVRLLVLGERPGDAVHLRTEEVDGDRETGRPSARHLELDVVIPGAAAGHVRGVPVAQCDRGVRAVRLDPVVVTGRRELDGRNGYWGERHRCDHQQGCRGPCQPGPGQRSSTLTRAAGACGYNGSVEEHGWILTRAHTETGSVALLRNRLFQPFYQAFEGSAGPPPSRDQAPVILRASGRTVERNHRQGLATEHAPDVCGGDLPTSGAVHHESDPFAPTERRRASMARFAPRNDMTSSKSTSTILSAVSSPARANPSIVRPR